MSIEGDCQVSCSVFAIFSVRALMQQEYTKSPDSSYIPLLGTLFRREVRDESSSELVLLITPHVLITLEEGKAVQKLSGLEGRCNRSMGAPLPSPRISSREKQDAGAAAEFVV